MTAVMLLLILVILFSLFFDFTNGFHDASNAIATVVSTGVLSWRTAVIMAATLNFIGAFFATRVASTIEHGLITQATQLVVLSAAIGAISWNLITWYYGLPSSSSHALVGGLVGAGIVHGSTSTVIWSGVGGRSWSRWCSHRSPGSRSVISSCASSSARSCGSRRS